MSPADATYRPGVRLEVQNFTRDVVAVEKRVAKIHLVNNVDHVALPGNPTRRNVLAIPLGKVGDLRNIELRQIDSS